MVISVKVFQTEITIETCLNGLKLYCKWPLFVNNSLFWWSAAITLDTTNDVLIDVWPVFMLCTLLHVLIGLTINKLLFLYQFREYFGPDSLYGAM